MAQWPKSAKNDGTLDVRDRSAYPQTAIIRADIAAHFMRGPVGTWFLTGAGNGATTVGRESRTREGRSLSP